MFSTGEFINPKNVYETVNHGILLDKLYRYGTRGIILENVSSYSHLKGRAQVIQIGKHTRATNVISKLKKKNARVTKVITNFKTEWTRY